jgi:hypothetical protein
MQIKRDKLSLESIINSRELHYPEETCSRATRREFRDSRMVDGAHATRNKERRQTMNIDGILMLTMRRFKVDLSSATKHKRSLYSDLHTHRIAPHVPYISPNPMRTHESIPRLQKIHFRAYNVSLSFMLGP